MLATVITHDVDVQTRESVHLDRYAYILYIHVHVYNYIITCICFSLKKKGYLFVGVVANEE